MFSLPKGRASVSPRFRNLHSVWSCEIALETLQTPKLWNPSWVGPWPDSLSLSPGEWAQVDNPELETSCDRGLFGECPTGYWHSQWVPLEGNPSGEWVASILRVVSSLSSCPKFWDSLQSLHGLITSLVKPVIRSDMRHAISSQKKSDSSILQVETHARDHQEE